MHHQRELKLTRHGLSRYEYPAETPPSLIEEGFVRTRRPEFVFNNSLCPSLKKQPKIPTSEIASKTTRTCDEDENDAEVEVDEKEQEEQPDEEEEEEEGEDGVHRALGKTKTDGCVGAIIRLMRI